MKPSNEKRSGGVKMTTPLPPKAAASHRWTFLTNHSHVLIAIHLNPDMILREVALLVGITERAVQRIVQELEEEGYIRRRKVGRKNQYEVLAELPLRHPLECHRSIGDLLRLFVVNETKQKR